MVNFDNPVVISREFLTVMKLWHVLDGLYIWEYLTTLDYEWSVIRGDRPYRRTIWLYSYTRVATLAAVINNIVGFDVPQPIDCQLWITFELILAYPAIAIASLLILLRVYAIFIDKIVYAIAVSAWAANVSCLIHGIVQLRGEWSTTTNTCMVPNAIDSKLNIIVTLSTDIILLLMMLAGLLRWRLEVGSTSILIRVLCIQGLIWFFLVTIGHVPPMVFISLNLNAPLNLMFATPALITLSIPATRMYRSLTDYNSRDISISLPLPI
ncbi:hypothetical protein BC827DRAFT_545992 [Russula dissimulans]|nr:hypothetical protein BC827DRAFT_545992 [Russula dissimulans]